MKYMIIVLAIASAPVSAEYLGHSQYDPGLGGWRYYSSPNAGAENAAAARNMIEMGRLLQQNRALQMQYELNSRQLDIMEQRQRRMYRGDRRYNPRAEWGMDN